MSVNSKLSFSNQFSSFLFLSSLSSLFSLLLFHCWTVRMSLIFDTGASFGSKQVTKVKGESERVRLNKWVTVRVKKRERSEKRRERKKKRERSEKEKEGGGEKEEICYTIFIIKKGKLEQQRLQKEEKSCNSLLLLSSCFVLLSSPCLSLSLSIASLLKTESLFIFQFQVPTNSTAFWCRYFLHQNFQSHHRKNVKVYSASSSTHLLHFNFPFNLSWTRRVKKKRVFAQTRHIIIILFPPISSCQFTQ